jgi:hypothetical protein
METGLGLDLGRWEGTPDAQAGQSAQPAVPASRRWVIGLLLAVSLLAFEIFNFDTTRYALNYFLGEVSFAGLRWATILALAFCAIDFAGLAYVLSPERRAAVARESWYLMGAWLLGATMNALMTWWAVSLTLLSHDLGNEVIGREQLLKFVPVFVAVLVWLTRILFIGAFSAAGERLFQGDAARPSAGAHVSVRRPSPAVGPPANLWREPVRESPRPVVARPAVEAPRPSALQSPMRPAAPRPVPGSMRPRTPVAAAASRRR